MSPRARLVAFGLSALGSVSCGGSTVQQSTETTAATAVIHPPPVDPVLADATADATMVIRIDGDTLRRSSFYAGIRQMAQSTTVATACDGDPLAQVDHATLSLGPNGAPSLVVRGPVVEPERAACASALGTAFQLHEAPVRIGNALVFADPTRATVAREALEQGANAGANRPLAAMREAVRGDGIVVLSDFARIRPTAEVPRAAFPGLDLETTRSLWNGLAAAAIAISVPGGDHLSLTIETEFDSHDRAEQARTWISAVLSRALGSFRTMMQNAASDPQSESLRAQTGTAFDQVQRSMRITTEGTHARLVLELDAESAGILSALAIPAFTQYTRRARTTEARDRIAYLSRQAVMYATVQRRSSAAPSRRPARRTTTASPFPPSAPRTPADVPRGVRVVDPAGAWDHPTWSALAFSMSDPHYYSYEFVNQGTAFTVRAYGDLDGDGTLSTFERSGRLNAQGEVELDRDVHVTNETE